jgi:hypothetical protein
LVTFEIPAEKEPEWLILFKSIWLAGHIPGCECGNYVTVTNIETGEMAG